MGADLITVGYTIDSSKEVIDLSDVFAALMDIEDKELLTHIGAVDPYEQFEDWVPDRDEDDESILETHRNKAIAKEMREFIAAGAQYVRDPGRHTASWMMMGTSWEFVVTGGTSWGDDPWEGWRDLCRFLDAADIWPAVGEAIGLVCVGLPTATDIADHTAASV